MKEFYVWQFVVAGVLWLACLSACFFGVRLSLRRSPLVIRKALTLCVMALVISFLGSRVYRLHFDYTEQFRAEGASAIVDSTHWHIESWWFFRFSELLALISTLVAVVIWLAMKNGPNKTPEPTP